MVRSSGALNDVSLFDEGIDALRTFNHKRGSRGSDECCETGAGLTMSDAGRGNMSFGRTIAVFDFDGRIVTGASSGGGS